MGCINTKKLGELRNENVFRVRAVQLQPEVQTSQRNGYLEVNDRELIWTVHNREPIVWALQHLRRYGLNIDVFSFEAGRRCMTGPGIYTFRLQHAEELYQLFQHYVNAVSNVTNSAAADEHPSHLFLNRSEHNSHTNNYLEPAPLSGGNMRAALQDALINAPFDLDSPDSVPSISFTNEVVHFSTNQQIAAAAAAVTTATTPTTMNTYVNTNNIYMEQPFRNVVEHNNNNNSNNVNNNSTNSSTSTVARILNGGSVSAYSTLNRKSFKAKGSSLDIPPEECAPLLNIGSAAIYANVDCAGSNCLRLERAERERLLEASERCYENLSRLDMRLLLQANKSNVMNTTSKHTLQRNASLDQQPMQITAVNYIVLDLDQPKSPAQCSPKTCFGSGLSLSVSADKSSDALSNEPQSLSAVSTTNPKSIASKDDEDDSQHQHSYSTIDFVKTCALIKSTTQCSEFDHEESRLTRHSRHSKCVRKAFSISE